MTTRKKRRNNRRNIRNANRRNGSSTAPSSHHIRRNSIAQVVLSDSDRPPSIVDSDECTNTSLSSAAEDYFTNLAENESSSDTSDVHTTGISRESSPPPPSRHSVITEGLRAYDSFSDPGRIEVLHVCRPEKSAAFRLALHRAAEVLGATSESYGKGKDRKVVMTMEIDHNLPLSRDQFEVVLNEIVQSLFSAPKKFGKERQKERRRRLQMERQRRKTESFLSERITVDLRLRGSSKKSKKKSNAPEERVGRSNVGYGMLERMGWTEGQGLGAEGEGRREPLEAERRRTRAGLGS